MLQPLSPDTEFLVCGTGSIGLLILSLLHFRGYREIVATEIMKGRQKIAQKLDFGVQVVHPDILVSEFRNAKNDGDEDWGFDVVINCTGDPKVFEDGLKYLRHGGKLLLLGACPANSEAKVDPHDIYAKELKIFASHTNPFVFTQAIQVVQDMGKQYLSFDKLGVRAFQLQEYMAALETVRSGEISKAVFENWTVLYCMVEDHYCPKPRIWVL